MVYDTALAYAVGGSGQWETQKQRSRRRQRQRRGGEATEGAEREMGAAMAAAEEM